MINHLNWNASYINQFLKTRERRDGQILVLLGWVCFTYWVRFSRGRKVHVTQKENQICCDVLWEVMKRKGKARKQVRSTNSAQTWADVFPWEQWLQTHMTPKKSSFKLNDSSIRAQEMLPQNIIFALIQILSFKTSGKIASCGCTKSLLKHCGLG